MLLRFGKGLLKAENVIEGMDRTPLLFVAKIKSFISIWLLAVRTVFLIRNHIPTNVT